MKQIKQLVFLGTLLSLPLCAENQNLLEAKFSYFLPSSKKLRDIYHTGGANYALSYAHPIWKWFYVKAEVDYFFKEGRSLAGGEKTTIRIIPLSLGPYFAYDIGNVSLYGGMGFRYFFVKIDNNSTYVNPRSRANGMGGYFEVGSLIFVKKHVFFDLFTSYSMRRLRFNASGMDNVSSNSIQVGGFQFGGGVGIRF